MSTKEKIVNMSASPAASDAVAEKFIQGIEKEFKLKRNWDEATELRLKKLGREGSPYIDFRTKLKTSLTELIAAERNGWVNISDGLPPVGDHVQLLMKEGTLVLNAQLKGKKDKAFRVVKDGTAIIVNAVVCWKSITFPGEFGRGELSPIEVVAKANEKLDEILEEHKPIDTKAAGNE